MDLKDLEAELGMTETLAVEASRVRIHMESRRYGKNVTILEGFDPNLDLEPLAKGLKNKLGTGGTVKDRTIELQGDHRKGAAAWLAEQGFRVHGP